MWRYEKRLQYPVNIKEPNAKIAKIIISQYGGPDGEMGASMRYLSQRYSMENRRVAGLLTDIGVSVSKLHISKTHKDKAHHKIKRGSVHKKNISPLNLVFIINKFKNIVRLTIQNFT